MRRILIDGYNLLHQVPELKRRETEALEDWRKRLIGRLVAFSADRKIDFHLVFDSSQIRLGSDTFPGVRVDYASPSADGYIRNIISRNQGNHDLVIVSSDRKDIGLYARSNQLEWETSEQFWRQMTATRIRQDERRSDRGSEGAAPPGWTSEDDDWLRREFED